MIAAGSVVTSNVKSNELFAGNPARFKKKIKNDKNFSFGFRFYGSESFKGAI